MVDPATYHCTLSDFKSGIKACKGCQVAMGL